MRYIVCVIFIFLLSSCSPVAVGPNTQYILHAMPALMSKKPSYPISILVMESEGYSIYNTRQMAYSLHPLQVAYFSNNGWADTPVRMLSPLIAEALQNTHYFHAVGLFPSPGTYDYILNVQVMDLRQEFFACGSSERLTLQVQLINSHNNNVIAAKRFSVLKPAPENTPYGGVVAANRATADILGRVVIFCLSTL